MCFADIAILRDEQHIYRNDIFVSDCGRNNIWMQFLYTSHQWTRVLAACTGNADHMRMRFNRCVYNWRNCATMADYLTRKLHDNLKRSQHSQRPIPNGHVSGLHGTSLEIS